MRTLMRFCLPLIGPTVVLSIMCMHPMSFWATQSDYADLSLAHAINIESYRLGLLKSRDNYPQLMHPGLPFQVASWLALKLANGTRGGITSDLIRSEESIKGTLADPGQFWWMSRGLAIVTLAIGSLLFAWIAHSRRWRPAVTVVPLFAFCINSTYPFFGLSNDGFAPVLAALVACAVLLRRDDALSTTSMCLTGMVCGIAYLSKLPYLTWLVAACSALIFLRSRRVISTRDAATFAGCVLGGFIAMVSVCTLLFFGLTGTIHMLQLHTAVFLGSGLYGTGDRTVVSPARLWAIAQEFVTERTLLTVLLCVTAGVLARSVWQNGKGGRALTGNRMASEGGRAELFIATWSMFAVAIGLAAVLKHWAEHYLLMVTAAAVPGLMIVMNRLRVWAQCVILILIVAQFVQCADSWNREMLSKEPEYLHLTRALSLIDSGESGRGMVVYDYRTPSPGFVRPFVAALSGLPNWVSVVGEIPPPGAMTAPWFGGYAAANGKWLPLDSFEWTHVCVMRQSIRSAPESSRLRWQGYNVEVVSEVDGKYAILRRVTGENQIR